MAGPKGERNPTLIETVIFVVTHAAIFYVIFWIIQNDESASIDQQVGFLRMGAGGKERLDRRRSRTRTEPRRRNGKQR